MKSMLGLMGFMALACMSATPVSHAAQVVSSVNTGECVHRPRGFTPDGTPIFLFHCHGVPNEQWSIANGQITASGGMCLDVQGSVPTEGAPVIIVACNGRPSQAWSILKGQIIGVGGKCLDASGGSLSDHTPLIISSCSSSPTQQWSVQ
jgi:cytochrome c